MDDIRIEKNSNVNGFVKIILIILVALALLKIVFNLNIFDVLADPRVKDAVDYINKIFITVWNNGLSKLLFFAWDNGREAVNLGWKNLLILLDKIQKIANTISNR